MNSIGRKVDGNTVYVGTNATYASVHHFGAKKGSFGTFVHMVKSHQRQVTQAFGKQLKFPVWANVHAHAREVSLPWGDIPARPFMLLQDEDVDDIKGLLETWIMEGKI
jgi:phage gpG-like protein